MDLPVRNQKAEEEVAFKFNKEDFRTVKRGPLVENADKIKEYVLNNEGKDINLQAINKSFRNYLIIVIISRVGHRAGIPVNLTTEIFEKAKLKGNRYILKIYNYKTMTRDNKGVVNLILTPKLYFHLQFYIDKIRNPIMEKKVLIINMYLSHQVENGSQWEPFPLLLSLRLAS